MTSPLAGLYRDANCPPQPGQFRIRHVLLHEIEGIITQPRYEAGIAGTPAGGLARDR
jgi:hypothetical protein